MLAALVTLTVAAAAPDSSAELPGIWEGHVGTLPVRACFTRRDWGTFGAYYYLSRRQPISLEAEERGESEIFREGPGTGSDRPRWVIEHADADRLTARWTSGTRNLAVRLRRIARMEGEDSPCGRMAFHQPRLEGLRTVTSRASHDGVGFTRIVLDVASRFDVNFETFAMDGGDEAVQRINTQLGIGLAGSPPQWFECIQNSLEFNPVEGGFAESLAPAMITRRWLSVSHHWDGYCGGAHPSSSNLYRTFDRADGREIDLHDWFNESAIQRDRYEGLDDEIRTLRPAFRDVILAGWSAEDADCGDVVRDANFWNIGLSRSGLVFAPSLPHVAQACGEEFTVPFARLRPFLTEEGAANLLALAAEIAR
jgi:hypothetical protein